MYFRENLLIEVEFELKLEKNAVDILTLNLGVISLIAHTETPPTMYCTKPLIYLLHK